MPVYIVKEKVLHFAHIPKAAGSSVKILLEKISGQIKLFSALPDKNERISIIGSPDHFTAADIKKLSGDLHDSDKFISFAIVRNPFSRLISEYNFQQGKSLTSQLPFNMWVLVVLTAAKIEPRIYENHIRPQKDFIFKKTKTFKLETDIEKFKYWIKENFDVESKGLTHTNKSNKSNKKPIVINKNIEALIIEYYEKDFEKFDYEKASGHTTKNAKKSSPMISLMCLILARLLVFHQRLNF